MATETVVTTSSTPHYVAYGALLVALVVVGWLWRDSQVQDAELLKNLAAAKSTQTVVDKQADISETAAQKNLQKQNSSLAAQLAAAKTEKQQIELINTQLGTKLSEQPQATNPSLPYEVLDHPSDGLKVVIPASDIPTIAQQAVDFKEAENQVAADKIEIIEKDQQITARDNTIAAQTSEITALKGGSHLQRFFKAAKYIGIGVATGIIIDRVK